MVGLGAGFLEDGSGSGVDDDGVGCEDEGWFTLFFVIGFLGVDGLGLLCCGAEDVLKRGEGFGEVLFCV
jgi:hypothetical protein